jgi:hypothetical protein
VSGGGSSGGGFNSHRPRFDAGIQYGAMFCCGLVGIGRHEGGSLMRLLSNHQNGIASNGVLARNVADMRRRCWM